MAPNDVKTPNPKSHMEVVLHIQYGLHKCSACIMKAKIKRAIGK